MTEMLTVETIRKIRLAARDGKKAIRQIAKDFNVSRNTVILAQTPESVICDTQIGTIGRMKLKNPREIGQAKKVAFLVIAAVILGLSVYGIQMTRSTLGLASILAVTLFLLLYLGHRNQPFTSLAPSPESVWARVLMLIIVVMLVGAIRFEPWVFVAIMMALVATSIYALLRPSSVPNDREERQ